ncbi:MAG: peptidyl-prolyl cis-trans isomerase [Gammaproteobacteria bacterium]
MLALAVLAFAVDRLRPPPSAPQEPSSMLIVVPAEDSAQRQRESFFGDVVAAPKQQDETESWIRDEVLYREALRLGLDNNDIVVRRRLVQKMEYLLDGMTLPEAPSESELAAYYRDNAARYEKPAAQSFTQIFIGLDAGTEAATDRAAAILESLREQDATAAQRFGDPTPDAPRVWRQSETRIAQRFGEDFLRSLQAQPMRQWSGPIVGRHGLYLLYREEAIPAQLPPLENQREAVLHDFVEAARARQRQEHYERLAQRYRIERAERIVARGD